MRVTSNYPWPIDFFALSAIWGSSFLFTRMAVGDFGTAPTTALRVGIAALFLLPIALMRGQGPHLWRHRGHLLVLGLFSSAIPFACFAFALLSISTGLSSILNATVPLFGTVIAWIWLKDRPALIRWVGLAIGFIGVVLLASGKASFKPDAQGNVTGWAVLACLLGTFCYGIAASYARRFLQGVPALTMATGSQMSATLALLGPAVFMWPEVSPSLEAWTGIVVVGVLCTGVAYILYFRLVERAGPTPPMAVTFCIPVFALAYGALLLGEEITPWMIVCCLIIGLGTGLSTGLIKPQIGRRSAVSSPQ